MNIIKIPIILVALLLCCVPDVSAQVQSSPLSAIGKSVTERMPGWKLTKWRLMNNDGVNDKVIFYDWDSGEEKVRAAIELLPSPEEAAELFKTRPGGWGEERSGVRVLEESFMGIGDESHLMEYEGSGRRGIVFRKGRVIVRVTAPSQGVAEQFATYIADAILAAQQLIQPERE
ncbi:MAG TPA: hypothetical protein VF543_15615 [Pyrinomonadaceae bacterium]